MSTATQPQRPGPHRVRRQAAVSDKPRAQRPATPSARRNAIPGRVVAIGVALVVLVVVTIAVIRGPLGIRRPTQQLLTYTVSRGQLTITVTERGNLESQQSERVLCHVDDVNGDGISGTPIVWIVENGTSVNEGDLIVELEDAKHRDRLETKTLDVEQARAEQIQATVQYENQITQNETALAEAKLQVELAELALKQFGDEEAGTFQIELQDVELLVQEAEAERLIEKTNLNGVEQLYRLGYRGDGDLAEARLRSLQSDRKLATAISRRKELVEYQYQKTIKELEGAVASAKRSLQQVERDNVAALAQARARMEAADEALKNELDVLARYKQQVEFCKIYAPQDGMVAYATAGSSRYQREDIRAGALVRERQPILELPNLKKMQVKTAVHESVLDQIKAGLSATVRVDAFPGQTYHGSVQSVAVLPDQGGWMSSDTKVYRTVVTIDEEVANLKPGMTAVVEIHVDQLENVLTVPVQAIVQIKDDSWCYVDRNGRIERRLVELGPTNDKFVQIRQGLEEGDLVILNPAAVSDETRREEEHPGEIESASQEVLELAG